MKRRTFIKALALGALGLFPGFEGSCPKKIPPKKRDPLLDTGAERNGFGLLRPKVEGCIIEYDHPLTKHWKNNA